jgi:hypothetical protein
MRSQSGIPISVLLHAYPGCNSWWKVKIKGESQEEDSPVGLVPAAYVEPVGPCSRHTFPI